MTDRTPPPWLVTPAEFAADAPLSALPASALHKDQGRAGRTPLGR